MPKTIRRILLWALVGVSVIAVGCALWFWQYSPLHRAIAWYQLKQGKFATTTEGTQLVKVLLGSENAKITNISAYPLTTRDVVTETAERPVEFANTNSIDETFVAPFTYTFPIGVNGAQNIEYHQIYVENRLAMEYTVSGNIISAPVNQQTFTGTKPQETVKAELTAAWKALATALTKKDSSTAEQYIVPEEVEQIEKITKINDLAYRVAPTGSVTLEVGEETENAIKVGTVSLKQANCSISASIPILYLKDQRVYRFSNVYAALASMCSKPKPKPTNGTLSCSNCWLAPVSKQYALPASYVPYVVATGLNGGGYVTQDTKTALTKLFNDAKAKGISTARVSSSYRSYQVQQDLFNTYVKDEEHNGLSHSAAVAKANTYSALPGHSEHQLGTTLDLVACAYPCTFYNSANTPLYNYLKANAHKFGFAISYPDGSQPYTGYTYEPWHIRYIGITRATELHNRGYLTKKGFYLYQFLLEKGEY